MSGLGWAALAVGLVMAIVSLPAMAAPAAARELARRFPRNRPAAWALTALALLWSGVWLHQAPFLADLAWARTGVWIAMPVSFVLLVAFLDELLAPRALGGLFLLAPAWMLGAAFVHNAPSKAVVVVLAYLLVIAGMFLVMSPYRFRTTTAAALRSDARARAVGAAGLALGLVLVGLALTAYR